MAISESPSGLVLGSRGWGELVGGAPLKADACSIEGPVLRPPVYQPRHLPGGADRLGADREGSPTCTASSQHIHRVYRQGPTGIHVVVSNEVSAGGPPHGTDLGLWAGARNVRPAGLGG